jgi:hypothetical protein
MRAAGTALLLGLALSLSSCYFSFTDIFAESSRVTERAQDGGAKPIVQPGSGSISASAPFSFLVVGDPHFGASFAAGGDVLASFAALARSPDPNSTGGALPYAFVLYLGDDVDNGTDAQYRSFTSWASSMKDSLGAPLQWYSALGNHDLYNDGWSRFRDYIGPSFFRLSAGAWSIYILDSGQGTLGTWQLEELKRQFASDPRPKIVVTHYPVYAASSVFYDWRMANPLEVATLLDLFARSNVSLIVCGHFHYLVHETIGPMDEWLVESLTVKEGGMTHCFRITLDGAARSLERLAF